MEEKVICPLIDDLIEPVDCLENQVLKENSIPLRFKIKGNWKDICKNCEYQNK